MPGCYTTDQKPRSVDPHKSKSKTTTYKKKSYIKKQETQEYKCPTTWRIY